MIYKICPICNGTGELVHLQKQCYLCKGKKILNKTTNKPPKFVATEVQISMLKKLGEHIVLRNVSN